MEARALEPRSAAGLSLLERPGEAGRPALLLLHGIGSHAESWRALMQALPGPHRAIAWDAPGYGGSTPVPEPAARPEHYAAALRNLLDALGLERVILAGHSLGCLFAARFAATWPERVAGLALLSPALGYAVPPGAPLPAGVQARIDDLRQLGPEAFAEKRAARLLHQPERKPAVLEGVRRAMAAVKPEGYAQAVHALGAGDLLADAALLRGPLLVAVGAEDVVTPPANARRLQAALPPGTPLHDMPEAGHALPQEAPGATAALLAGLMMDGSAG